MLAGVADGSAYPLSSRGGSKWDRITGGSASLRTSSSSCKGSLFTFRGGTPASRFFRDVTTAEGAVFSSQSSARTRFLLALLQMRLAAAVCGRVLAVENFVKELGTGGIDGSAVYRDAGVFADGCAAPSGSSPACFKGLKEKLNDG